MISDIIVANAEWALVCRRRQIWKAPVWFLIQQHLQISQVKIFLLGCAVGIIRCGCVKDAFIGAAMRVASHPETGQASVNLWTLLAPDCILWHPGSQWDCTLEKRLRGMDIGYCNGYCRRMILLQGRICGPKKQVRRSQGKIVFLQSEIN